MRRVTKSIQLPNDLHEHYQAEAKRRMTSIEAVLRETLAEHIDERLASKRHQSRREETRRKVEK